MTIDVQGVGALLTQIGAQLSAPPPPFPGFVKTFEPDLTKPVDLYDFAKHPSGLFKSDYWFGSDGDDHLLNGSISVWPQSAGSRAGGSDAQTYSDVAYNGINPFSNGPDGVAITAAKNPTVTTLTPNAYTGGLLTTQNSFKQRYGYFVADVSVPAVRGSWPAFWLLGEPYTPYEADEIDVGEWLGGTPGQVYQNAHSPRLNWNAPAFQAPFVAPRLWLSLLWTPDTLTWFVNGHHTQSCPNPGFHTPMYILLDHAVGPTNGGWAAQNYPPDDTALPAVFTVHGLQAWRLP